MKKTLIAVAAALTVTASVASAGTVTIVGELGGGSSGLSGALNVTETTGSPLNYYGVANNTNAELLGFGVSAIDSAAAWLDTGFGGVSSFECDFQRGNNWCYESRLLNAANWLTELVDPNDYLGLQLPPSVVGLTQAVAQQGPTFFDVFGAFTDYVSGSENTINWYDTVDGAMLAGDTSDGYFAWQSLLPASNILGIGQTGAGAAAFTAGQARAPSPVPLPAAAWLLLAGLGSLGAVRARRKA